MQKSPGKIQEKGTTFFAKKGENNAKRLFILLRKSA